ncbi:hypothetical protein AMJ57_00515 [Parcubacteria bacterium SG8_24]|nr:MAG: hypothetical protein AMJ57_00515 [Parcubacteria bacterium SG8_24]
MFRAIWRFLKAVGYFLTGRIDKAREALSLNPHVVNATYDDIIRQKTGRIQDYSRAVAEIVTIQEKRKATLKQLTEETGRLEGLKAGALAKAKQRLKQLQAQGLTPEQIKADSELMKHQGAFKDFSSTLGEKEARIQDLEAEIQAGTGKIEEHKRNMLSLKRDLDKIKAEKGEAVADIITAQEEQRVADMLSGIAEDTTSEQLQQMRDLRQKAKARARVAETLAGTDTKAQEAEYMAYAESSEADSEFFSELGLTEESPATVEATGTEAAKGTPLPE